MALARNVHYPPKDHKHTTTTDREGKAAQRKRNKEAGSVSRAGSSGAALSVKDFPKRSWEELAEGAEHLCDVAGKISHSQIGASGWLVTTLNSPKEYAHDMLDAHMKGSDGMVYIRVYYVPIDVYMPDLNGDAEDSDEGTIDFLTDLLS